MVYTFGFDKLGYEKCHFDVMKGNNKVISFHKKFGAKITAEDEKNYYFNLSKDDVNNVRPSLEKLL
jgi:RimJ/RimL family protein N-acetyltransferase